ncbi:MAG: metallophosphoesterase [Clostridia bacterium]|nr:metallophosphoesterase [Clostridia bacterium]
MVFFVRKLIMWIMSLLMIPSLGLFGNFHGAYTPKKPYDVKLTFAAISDTHITDEKARQDMLGMGLVDMAEAEYPLDAIVHAGDITDHGNTDMWENVAGAFEKYNKVPNVILAEGNHDTWNNEEDGDDRFPESKELFIKYNKIIANRELDNVYYSTKVNGYTFIVLGSERDNTNAYISDTQLEWFKAEMDKAAEDGLPIFVVLHQPINGTHGLPDTWELFDDPDPDEGGIGDQSDEVEAILKSYDNVFFISGHVHSGIGDKVSSVVSGYKSIESEGSFHSINLPTYMYTNALKGIATNCTGFSFEVYENEVVVRARCFASSTWYTCYDYTIPLV